jgi:undecaprenyl phosphate N,N'-diacetylbacillosamine 1-phosphate transferase
MFYRNFFKPILDKLFAITLFVLLLPVILLTALFIRLFIGSPIFFRQSRPGLNEKIFKIWKFRTMTNERDQNGELLPDEMRLKGLGKIIRSLSLDELPQLLNVAFGEMSFIGPRPLLIEYLPRYSNFQKERHSVKSGISGLAQIKGRNNLSWKNRFRYDVFYARNISLKLDLYIIFLTIWKVIRRSDINQNGKATAEKFIGTL